MARPLQRYIALLRFSGLIAGVVLLIACPANGLGGQGADLAGAKPAAPQSRSSAQLHFNQGQLEIERAGKEPVLLSGSYLSYSIVSAGELSLVTTIGPDLAPITWATDGSAIHRYPDMLPLIVQPPVIALAGMPTDVSMSSAGTTLLGTDGSTAWQHDSADLLWPAAGDPGAFAFVVIPGTAPEPLLPYGKSPRIACIECPVGTEVWSSVLPTAEPVLDIQLYAVGPRSGVLCIQHGYQDYNLWSLDRQTGALKPFHTWSGAPANQAVYPGPSVQPTGIELDGEQVVMRAYVEGQGWRRWMFDIGEWRLISDVAAEPLPGMVEDNPHPVGGSGVPQPGSPVFPQGLLPQQFGDSWTIPALVNARGAVLVIDAYGARWVSQQ